MNTHDVGDRQRASAGLPTDGSELELESFAEALARRAPAPLLVALLDAELALEQDYDRRRRVGEGHPGLSELDD